MIIEDVRNEIEAYYGSPLQAISDCLRGFIVASPGKKLIAVDFSSIEARVLAWLAGEEWKLKVFRENGDTYIHAAARIYNVPVDSITKEDPRRQVGKVADLALGYQGGKGALNKMGKNYGVKFKEKEAETIKVAWREAHPHVKAYWNGLNEAAFGAVLNPGLKCHVMSDNRRVTYRKSGAFLFYRLPSGRVLAYPYARIGLTEPPWSREKRRIAQEKGEPLPEKEMIESVLYKAEENKQWREHAGYGGLFTENVVQATARDLLADALLKLDDEGFDIVGHVHDEIILETDSEGAEARVKEVCEIACQLPTWAAGLPLTAGGWADRRYRK